MIYILIYKLHLLFILNMKFTENLITDYFKSSNKTGKKQLRQTLITYYYWSNKKIIKGYNKYTDSWHCTSCGVDMGRHNPRQLCRKTWCPEL